MNDYAYEIPELAETDYEASPLPAEGLRITFFFVFVSLLVLLISWGLYLSAGRIPALVLIGIWGVLIVFASPRAGVVLALTLQVWDVALNPAREGGYTWISPGRALPVICLLAYLRFLVGRKPAVESVKTCILLLFAFVLWALCLITVAQSKILAIVVVLKIFIQIALLLVAVDLLSGRKMLQQTLFLMAIGGVTGGLYALFGGFAIRAAAAERLILPGLGINALANSVGLAIMAAVALLALQRSVVTILVVIFSVIGMLLVVLRMGTRAVVISIPLATMFGMLLGYWKKVHKLFIFSILMAALLGGSLYWALQTGFITGELRERVLSVFVGQTYQTNVRVQLWKDALRIYARKPQGTGPGNEPVAYLAYSTTGNLESHTVFLSVLVECNVIGLGIFLAAFSALAVAVLRVRDPALRCGAGMILGYCFLIAMATSILETRFFWQPVMLVMVIVETDFRARHTALDGYEEKAVESFETEYENQRVYD